MIERLKLLLPGQLGYGMMIETDGYISPEHNKKFISEMEKIGSGETIIEEPLYVYAILQKCNVENRNGRVYPDEILKREANKYQELIKQRSGIGVSDHPECVRGDSDILTKSGWKNIKELLEDEEILTLNPDNDNIEIKKITKFIKKPFNGNLIRLYNNNIDLCVTSNHKFWIKDRQGNGKFITANDIIENRINDQDKCYIPKKGKWISKGDDNFIIKGIKENDLPKRYEKNRKLTSQIDLKIPMDVMMMFMGIYLSEGHISGVRKNVKSKYVLADGTESYCYGDKNPKKIVITQKKIENIVLIEEMLSQFPLEWKKNVRKNGTVDFSVNDLRLHTYLSKFGKSINKYVPEEIKNQSKENLELFFNWFLMGDGRIRGKKNKSYEVFSISKKLMDDLQEIGLKIGYSGNIRIEDRKFDRYITENGVKRLISKENSHDMYFYHRSTTNGVMISLKSLKFEIIPHNDFVYCVEVPNHIFYIRRNGKSIWTGNSSIITVDDVSHEVKEIWWEGNTLMGKIEIIMSPGFIKYGIASCKGDRIANLLRKGIRIGVSSRGVGSLEKQDGKNIVQTDFELICWDIVTQPSTPGSYIFNRKDEAIPFMETIIKKEPLIENIKLKNSIDKFLGLL